MSGEPFEDPIASLHGFLLDARPAARERIAQVREARATAPAPGADGMRAAYLELLKLSLCDLTGTSTVSVGTMRGGGTASRTLRDDDLKLRAIGLDWPLEGLTMVGLERLDDLQSCVEELVRDGVEGDLIEAGAWRGGASILMRATLDALGEDAREVWVADSFQGFPVDDAVGEIDLGTYDFLAVPLEEVQANFARFGLDSGVRFVPGFFEDTLPSLVDRNWALVRLDGDTYEATMTTLESLYPGLSPGGHVVVDDYLLLDDCQRAVDDFRERHGIAEPLQEIDWNSVRWRRESDEPIERRRTDETPAKPTPVPVDRRARSRDVPTVRELQLERELAELRGRRGHSKRSWRTRLFNR
jgi:hypothetical protein